MLFAPSLGLCVSAPAASSEPFRLPAQAEMRILQASARALNRCDLLFAQCGIDAFQRVMLSLSARQSVDVPCDVNCSPAFVEDVAQAALDLLIDDESGIWHLSHGLAMNAAHFVALLAQHRGVPAYAMRPRPLAEISYATPRPGNTALISERGQLLPSLEDALKRSTIHNAVLR